MLSQINNGTPSIFLSTTSDDRIYSRRRHSRENRRTYSFDYSNHYGMDTDDRGDSDLESTPSSPEEAASRSPNYSTAYCPSYTTTSHSNPEKLVLPSFEEFCRITSCRDPDDDSPPQNRYRGQGQSNLLCSRLLPELQRHGRRASGNETGVGTTELPLPLLSRRTPSAPPTGTMLGGVWRLRSPSPQLPASPSSPSLLDSESTPPLASAESLVSCEWNRLDKTQTSFTLTPAWRWPSPTDSNDDSSTSSTSSGLGGVFRSPKNVSDAELTCHDADKPPAGGVHRRGRKKRQGQGQKKTTRRSRMRMKNEENEDLSAEVVYIQDDTRSSKVVRALVYTDPPGVDDDGNEKAKCGYMVVDYDTEEWERWTQPTTGLQGNKEFRCNWPHNGAPTGSCGYTAKKQLVRRHVESTHLNIRSNGLHSEGLTSPGCINEYRREGLTFIGVPIPARNHTHASTAENIAMSSRNMTIELHHGRVTTQMGDQGIQRPLEQILGVIDATRT
ncbi:hypothetical protein AMATHDRAFT_45522 [Amanita thiersii Skay4041]|uniref:Uncharacterized protein n=1 Tax=Amanita thiersii Skay4041 TaxID=703135 RepID=A0A2A9NT16_9AGAR|nr:hypothetical protein AMATHDRAFT_45522 [Amanita thiersii Skay4041]